MIECRCSQCWTGCRWIIARWWCQILTIWTTLHLKELRRVLLFISEAGGVCFVMMLFQTPRRLRVVPHLSSGIVERAKREGAWKSPHARKGDTRRGERKMRDYRQSPSFWTNALLSQRKTVIGPSMEICQHLSKTRQALSTLDIITIYRTNN